MITNTTEKFQNIWLSIIGLYESVCQESLSKEESFSIQEEKFLEAQKLIKEGADINEPFYNETENNYIRHIYIKYTPLWHVLCAYHYTATTYMNNDFLDNMIYFLFQNDVVTDKASIKSCESSNRDFKLLEEILKRANDEDIMLKYTPHIKYLEIITGFNNVKLDEFIPYEFSYINKENRCIYFKDYNYLPIEVTFLDYATEKGSAIIDTQGRKDIINLLKKQGSPDPSLERINMMFSLMEQNEPYRSNMDNIKERFKEAYEFYINL